MRNLENTVGELLSPLLTKPSSRLAIFWMGIRPKTLSISLAPVFLGCALAFWRQGVFVGWVLGVSLVAALFIQGATNLLNDAGDGESGTDTPDRLGPPRVVALGWASASQVKAWAYGLMVAAFALGVPLVGRGGWPIVGLGLASLVAGWAYTHGPYPISRSPLGEVFVCLFFGLGAVGGTYYLQTLSLSSPALLLGAIQGALAAAVIVVNNTRDRDGDQKAGRKTLAVLGGRLFCGWEYGALLLLPCLVAALWAFSRELAWAAWGALACGFWSLGLIRRFFRARSGGEFNGLLAATAQFQLVFGILISLGIMGSGIFK